MKFGGGTLKMVDGRSLGLVRGATLPKELGRGSIGEKTMNNSNKAGGIKGGGIRPHT